MLGKQQKWHLAHEGRQTGENLALDHEYVLRKLVLINQSLKTYTNGNAGCVRLLAWCENVQGFK